MFNAILNPLTQFEIIEFLHIELFFVEDLHIVITNIGLYFILSMIVIFQIFSYGSKWLVINKWSFIQESMYHTIHNIVISKAEVTNKGSTYFPFIFSLFIIILINNLIGMVPYSFASTSHFLSTFSLSFMIVIGASILGFLTHGLNFFSLLVPAGCPLSFLPLLVAIEFISYLARCISLGLRLGANITSGHMLLHILSGFVYLILSSGLFLFILGLVPLTIIITLSGLELVICVIQALVFVILTSSYIKDGIDLH